MSNARGYRKYIEFGILCLLATALLWLFGRNLDWVEVRHAVSDSDPYLLAAAVVIICLAYAFRAFRWAALLKPLSTARFSDLFAATTIGFSGVFLVGRAGEFVRPVVLSFAINLIWFKPPVSLGVSFDRVRLAGVGLLAAIFLGIAFLTWFRKKSSLVIEFLERFFARWRFIPRKLSQLVLRILEQLAQALRVLVNFRELAETSGWTALVWFGITAANLLVMRAFHIQVGWSDTIFVLGWSLVGSLVPTPGGAAGAFHAATAAGLLFLGVKKETAAALSIVLHLVDFGPALLFGIFYVIRGDLSFSRLRAMISPQPTEDLIDEFPERVH